MKNKLLIGMLIGIAILVIGLGILFQFISREENPSNEENPGNNNSVNTGQTGNNNDINSIKTIVCSYENNSGGIKTTETYTFTHVNNNLKSYSMVLKYEYSRESEESALRYKGDSIKGQVEASLNVEGINITHTDENYVITNSYMYDLVKFDSSNFSVSSNILPKYNLNDSVNEIIEEVKGWKFSCKES